MSVDDRLDRTKEYYERAIFGGDRSMLAQAERDLDGVEADLALARGRIMHARFMEHHDLEDPRELALFERAAHLYHHLDDVRGEAEAYFWIGCAHQVIRQDDEAAVPALRRSCELAAQAGDKLTMSYALRHLGYADHMAGRLPEARAHLEESTELRRELGFGPGVAANLVGLAYVAIAQDRRDDALALLDEAVALAAAGGAQGIQPMIAEARAAL